MSYLLNYRVVKQDFMDDVKQYGEAYARKMMRELYDNGIISKETFNRVLAEYMIAELRNKNEPTKVNSSTKNLLTSSL